MNKLEIIKPDTLLWVDGVKSFYDGSSEGWSCPFKILSIEKDNENSIHCKIYDYDDMAEREFTFHKDGSSKIRVCHSIEIRKYLLQKKIKVQNKIDELKVKIEIQNLDMDMINYQITKLD